MEKTPSPHHACRKPIRAKSGVDAFPTRPTNGDRILRVFTNLNPVQNRVWLTSQTFDIVAARWAREIGLPRARRRSIATDALAAVARTLHWPGARRSPYEHFAP